MKVAQERFQQQKPGEPARPDRRSTDMLAAAARQAIVFNQHFPPPHDPAFRSFFGGAPIAPRGFEWPRFDGNKPLHFLMQVDCESIPKSARLGALPASGVLYFFLDVGSAGSLDARVIHADGIGWKVIAPPDDLGPVYHEHAPHVWAWAQSKEHCPVLLPKWPFEPVVIELPEPVVEEEGNPFLWPGDVGEKLVAAQGGPVTSNPITGKDVAQGTSLRRPFEEFPHDWRAVQICSAKLVEEADRARRYPRKSLFPELDDEARSAHLADISLDAQTWFDIAASKPAFGEVPRADRNAFWELLAEHAPITRYLLPDALSLAIECSLSESAEAAARVPAELAARVRPLHALAVTTDRGIHANIPDRMLAPPIDIQGNVWERAMEQLLLLEISSEEGIGHHFGEGVYQFWITPADLLAGRFDKVEVTADAY